MATLPANKQTQVNNLHTRLWNVIEQFVNKSNSLNFSSTRWALTFIVLYYPPQAPGYCGQPRTIQKPCICGRQCVLVHCDVLELFNALHFIVIWFALVVRCKTVKVAPSKDTAQISLKCNKIKILPHLHLYLNDRLQSEDINNVA